MVNNRAMTQHDLRAQFDAWAETYDAELNVAGDAFPFAAYRETLDTVWRQAEAGSGMTVLDVGVGTGNLAQFFMEAGCHVLGVDFSTEMLSKAGEKLPQLELVQADLTLAAWPPALNRRFERIVSNYVFHEFPMQTKLRLLNRLAQRHLHPRGHIVIGDISFPTQTALEKTRREAGDAWEEEYYWILDQTREALEPAGWQIAYRQTSFCAGVYRLHPPTSPS